MLILFTILVVLSAVIVIPFFWIKTRKSLSSENSRQFESPPPARSLFEPGDEEIRALKREEETRLTAESAEKIRQIALEKEKKARDFHQRWLLAPDNKNTLQLILLAAETNSAKIFSEISESVIKHWQAKNIKGVSADDLAAVLESHFRLLPSGERNSGVAFWLKREIAGLRANSAGEN